MTQTMASPTSTSSPPPSSNETNAETRSITKPTGPRSNKSPNTTTTTILSSTSLASDPDLSSLYNLINAAFALSHARHPELIPPSQLRLSSPQQLIDELGPSGFTLIIQSTTPDPDRKLSHNTTPIATVSCKPWAPLNPAKPTGATNAVAAASRNAAALAATATVSTSEVAAANEAALFRSSQRPSSSSPNDTATPIPAWEFFAMAVAPTHQSQGLASQLLDRVVREVRGRSAVTDTAGKGNGELKNGDGEAQQVGKIRLSLSTAKAFNEAYYLKKGFRTVRTIWVEKGIYGSETGFEVVDMEMVV